MQISGTTITSDIPIKRGGRIYTRKGEIQYAQYGSQRYAPPDRYLLGSGDLFTCDEIGWSDQVDHLHRLVCEAFPEIDIASPKSISQYARQLLRSAGMRYPHVRGESAAILARAAWGGRQQVLRERINPTGGIITEIDLPAAYPHAACLALPTGDARPIKEAAVRRDPSRYRWCAWIVATPPSTAHSIAPLPVRGKWGQVHWPTDTLVEGVYWDCDCLLAESLGWRIRYKDITAWPSATPLASIMERMIDLRDTASSGVVRDTIKMIALRMIGLMAWNGAGEEIVLIDPHAEKPQHGWSPVDVEKGVWVRPVPAPSTPPPTYYPQIAYAIWAAIRAQIVGCLWSIWHRVQQIHIDGAIVDGLVDGSDLVAPIRVKQVYEDVTESHCPYQGALILDQKPVKQPGVKRELQKVA